MRVKLEDVCERGSSNLRQSDVERKTGEYPIYGAAGYIGNVDFYHQEKPYVAVVKDGAGIGRTMLLPAKSSVIGTMQYLLPKENILPEYLKYVVQYMHLGKYFSGATIPHIYFKDYKNEEFNYAEIGEQRKIVEALKKVERILEARQRELQSLDDLTKARFVEMFGDGYNTVKLGAVIKTISGGTPSKSHSEYYKGGTIPWLTRGEANAGIITSVKTFITEEGMKNSSAKMVPANSVVIAMYGATAGVTGILRLSTTTNQAVCSLLPNDQYIPEYLYHAVSMKKGWMISQCKGGGQPNISQAIIKDMDIIDAPMTAQIEFSDFVKQIEKSKSTVQKALDEAQLLFDSLMQKYFG